jgi:hypothetical protein
LRSRRLYGNTVKKYKKIFLIYREIGKGFYYLVEKKFPFKREKARMSPKKYKKIFLIYREIGKGFNYLFEKKFPFK